MSVLFSNGKIFKHETISLLQYFKQFQLSSKTSALIITLYRKIRIVNKPPQENAEVFLDNDTVICRLPYRTERTCISGR